MTMPILGLNIWVPPCKGVAVQNFALRDAQNNPIMDASGAQILEAK